MAHLNGFGSSVKRGTKKSASLNMQRAQLAKYFERKKLTVGKLRPEQEVLRPKFEQAVSIMTKFNANPLKTLQEYSKNGLLHELFNDNELSKLYRLAARQKGLDFPIGTHYKIIEDAIEGRLAQKREKQGELDFTPKQTK